MVRVSMVTRCYGGQYAIGRYLKALRKTYQDKLGHANSTAEESISNIRTVRAFSNESKMAALYDIDINGSYQLGKKISLLIAGFSGVVFPLIYVSCLSSSSPSLSLPPSPPSLRVPALSSCGMVVISYTITT